MYKGPKTGLTPAHFFPLNGPCRSNLQLQKVVRWFLDADDNSDSHRNLFITFWPIYNVLWNLHANPFSGICIKSTN